MLEHAAPSCADLRDEPAGAAGRGATSTSAPAGPVASRRLARGPSGRAFRQPTAAGAPARRREDDDDDIDAVDAIDAELFPIFEEEAGNCCRSWARACATGPRGRRRAARAPRPACAPCTRSRAAPAWPARCAWARWRTGWRPPSSTCGRDDVAGAPTSSRCCTRVDAMQARFEHAAQRRRPAPAAAGRVPQRAGRAAAQPAAPASPSAQPPVAPTAAPRPRPRRPRASRRGARCLLARRPATHRRWRRRARPPARPAVRVRAPLLDRLVNQAGEVSITRARIESDVGQIRGSLGDLTENLERLRRQLRDIELQAETQMQLAHGAGQGRVAGLRSAGDGPLHALPGTDAHDGRVGERRGHGAAQPAAHAAGDRGRTGRAGAA